jgi:hypothetical protein
LILASKTSLRDLTVRNYGSGTTNVALMATDGMTRTLVADVSVQAQGNGANNYGVVIDGSSTGVLLQDVSALGENGSENNYGLYNNAEATLHGGSFIGRGGTDTHGIAAAGSGTTLEAISVTALGEKGTITNIGLSNDLGALVKVISSQFTGRGGTDARGIYNFGSGTTLEAESVTALAEDGSYDNLGLFNDDGAAANLRSGSFTGHGGLYANGIYSLGSDTRLEAESITVLGEGGSDTNYGLRNVGGAMAILRGGSFTGRGGTGARGIYNLGTGTTLEADSVTTLAEDGNGNIGLFNDYGAAANLRGGSYTGRGGHTAKGISNEHSPDLTATTLWAKNISALGEGGSSSSIGFNNFGSPPTPVCANVTQSVLEGATYSVYLEFFGDVTVSNSRLGGTVYGGVDCVAVSYGSTFYPSSCPP